jgi:hypothetical protein
MIEASAAPQLGMMPAQLTTRAIAVFADALAKSLDLSHQLFP